MREVRDGQAGAMASGDPVSRMGWVRSAKSAVWGAKETSSLERLRQRKGTHEVEVGVRILGHR